MFFLKLQYFVFFLIGASFIMTGCVGLETPHTFREDEEVKIRSKNLHAYHKELEEDIALGMYQIDLLEDAVRLKKETERTLSQQIENMEKQNKLKETEKKNLGILISNLDTELKKKTGERKTIEGNLNAEKQKTAEFEKNIGLEAGRIAEMRLKLAKIMDEYLKVQTQIDAAQTQLNKKKKSLNEVKKKSGEETPDLKKTPIKDAGKPPEK